MPRSLRSKLIVASVLWTAGLLALMHMTSLLLIHVMPRPRGVHVTWPVLLGLALMAAGVLALRRALTPFRRLRRRLAAVRSGNERRIEGSYPAEVQPLIEELNALLEDREKAIQKAAATAGDLAHGLKTPLAVLAQEAEEAEASGNPEVAERIGQQVERMSRQITYQLARARAASGASAAARCFVAPCAESVARTLMKLYGGRGVEIACAIAPEIAARVQREDLEEMLGNVLENACKWARRRIAVEASRAGATVQIAVDDDGRGLAPEMRDVVFQRGVRLDEAAPGSGLGLAIVRDLLELYGGSIGLEESGSGGLRVRLVLPAA